MTNFPRLDTYEKAFHFAETHVNALLDSEFCLDLFAKVHLHDYNALTEEQRADARREAQGYLLQAISNVADLKLSSGKYHRINQRTK